MESPSIPLAMPDNLEAILLLCSVDDQHLDPLLNKTRNLPPCHFSILPPFPPCHLTTLAPFSLCHLLTTSLPPSTFPNLPRHCPPISPNLLPTYHPTFPTFPAHYPPTFPTFPAHQPLTFPTLPLPFLPSLLTTFPPFSAQCLPSD